MATSRARSVKPALERMARALCTANGLPENTQFEGRPMWESFLPKARTALEAIRTPTGEMVEEGSCKFRGIGLQTGEAVREAWEVMIDEALRAD